MQTHSPESKAAFDTKTEYKHYQQIPTAQLLHIWVESVSSTYLSREFEFQMQTFDVLEFEAQTN